jgi:hypothetical protein
MSNLERTVLSGKKTNQDQLDLFILLLPMHATPSCSKTLDGEIRTNAGRQGQQFHEW